MLLLHIEDVASKTLRKPAKCRRLLKPEFSFSSVRVLADLFVPSQRVVGPLAVKVGSWNARCGAWQRYEAEHLFYSVGGVRLLRTGTTFIMASFGRGNGLFWFSQPEKALRPVSCQAAQGKHILFCQLLNRSFLMNSMFAMFEIYQYFSVSFISTQGIMYQMKVASYQPWGHTSNLSRIPRIYPCKFFLAGVNFYRFNAKNWHFDRFYVKKWLFFLQI